MFTLAFLVMGFIALQRIPTSLLPEIDIPQITIYTVENKLTAREIENNVTKILRQQLTQLQKLDNIESESHDGYSIIKLRFEYGSNINLTYIEANEKVDAAINYLPKNISRPRVIKAGASDVPVVYVNISLKNTFSEDMFLELSELAEVVLKRRLEQLPTVAMADMSGAMKPEVVIELNEEKIKRLNLSVSFFENLIRKNNIEPGNLVIQNGNYRYNLKFNNTLSTIDEIKEITFFRYNSMFKLSDFADVYYSKITENGFVTLNGERIVTLAVIKQSNARTSDLKQELDKITSTFNKRYKDLEFSITEDQSKLLLLSLSNLSSSLLIGSILAILIMFFFLKNPKSPLLIAISIPTSLLISILLLYFFGFSINIITLSGLVLGVGMMIDNSIIVIDNITREYELDNNLLEAANKGTLDVISPMISSVLTTVSVFLPLMFLSGISGALFLDQAIAVTIGLAVSLIVSITIIPVYFVVLNKKIYKWEKYFSKIDFVSNIEKWYEKGMSIFLKKSYITLSIISIFLLLTVLLSYELPIKKLPEITGNEFTLKIDWKEDISPYQNSFRIDELTSVFNKNTLVKSLIGHQDFVLNRHKPLEYYQSKIYLQFNYEKNEIDKLNEFFINHYPRAEYSIKRADNAFEQLFNSENHLYRAKVSSLSSIQIPPEIEFNDITQTMEEYGFKPQSSLGNNWYISVDFDKLNIYHIDLIDLLSELETILDNKIIGNLKSPQRFYPIKLRYKEGDFDKYIKTVHIKNRKGIELPIRNFVKLLQLPAYKTIYADNGGEFLSFYSDNENNVSTRSSKITDKFTDRFQIDFDGEWLEISEMEDDFMYIILISFLLLYFILAAQFESFIMPLIVLIELPIGIGGALFMLYIFGQSINVMAGIGIVVMSGIIINDSILKLHTINQLRKKGYEIYEAVKIGGKQRLKPILMTSITTILALLPFLFFTGLGAELQQPLALTVIGGLTVGTWVSLYFIPFLYLRIYK